MADLDAELAFLKSMQEDVSSDLPTPQNNTEATVLKQPRTIGGFIDDDDEDEEDMSDYMPNEVGSKGPFIVDRGSSNTPPQVRADSEVPSNDVPVQTAQQDQYIPDAAVPNGDSHDHASPHASAFSQDGIVAKESDVSTPLQNAPEPRASSVAQIDVSASHLPRVRLPHDRVGLLEDRIRDDPRGDLDAWLSLISEHKKRNKMDEVRNAYERFLQVFPSAAEQWVAYASMELEHNDFARVDQILGKSLLNVPNVQLWSLYLNYVRRRQNLSADPSGKARQTVTQTYEFVLENVGIDKDCGQLWQDYIQFIKSGPGQVGGTGWQDQQKMDSLRKAYQRAICIPTQAVNSIWKEYDAFEMGLNKVTGRKFLQEKSPAYMTARSSNTALQNLTRDLVRTSLPSMPPALGFDGDGEYREQVALWKKWIEWEKEDPLVLKEEDEAAYKARILYVYKQAVMALRFWPEIWYDAAQCCLSIGLESDSNTFLEQGAVANPESCLLAFHRADRLESTSPTDEGEESVVRRGKAVREPYDKVIDALYDIMNKVQEREAQAIARIKESFSASEEIPVISATDGDDDDAVASKPDPEATQKLQIEALQNGNAAQLKLLGCTVSFAWIALMRAMRRVQGKGKVGEPIGGFRQIFADARKRGKLTSDVYVASALMEHHCYKDPAATKIFERGSKLFKDDEHFALEYLKHLIAVNDTTNARAVFETTVTRLASKPETVGKAKPLFAFFHEFESQYGELSQIVKLEQRMREHYPEDPLLQLFSRRFESQGFDPTAVRPIVSPSQTRSSAYPSIERQTSLPNSPRPSISQALLTTNSPKRAYDDSDNESSAPPRKLARGESPLKGAAGRRMGAQKHTHLRTEHVPAPVQQLPILPPAPAPLPAGIMHLLSIIPRPDTYNAARLNPERMMNLVRNADLSRYQAGGQTCSTPLNGQPQYNYGVAPAYGR